MSPDERLLYMRDPIQGNIAPGHPLVLKLPHYALVPSYGQQWEGVRLASDRGPRGQAAMGKWIYFYLMPCWEVRYARPL